MNEENKDTVTLPRDLWEKARAILKYVTENGLPEQQPEPETEEPKKPTLDDYTTIRNYEDACEALGEAGMTNGYIYKEFDSCPNPLPRHILALMKLETVSRALWGGKTGPRRGRIYYLPAFNYDEYGNLRYDDFRCEIPEGEIRLCQPTLAMTEYFGRQFLPLWAEYLGFDTEKREGKR